MKRIVGVDEAGKGPVIGPMVISAVVSEYDKIDYKEKPPNLMNFNLKDSKKLKEEERELASKKIKEKSIDYKTYKLRAPHIDQLRKRKTMNQIMVDFFAHILNKIEFDVAVLDAADTDEKRFGEKIKNRIGNQKEVISKHKADEKYPIVSAASILAKTKRDKEIRKLEKIIDKKIGKGYPSDKKTKEFLKDWYQEKKELPVFCRKTWKTAKRIQEKNNQSNLEEY